MLLCSDSLIVWPANVLLMLDRINEFLFQNEIRWNKLVSEARKRRCRFRKILEGSPYDFSTVLEDFRNKEIPPSGFILQKFRRRLYGVMFHEKPTDTDAGSRILVSEWCMTGRGSLDSVQMAEAIKAPDFHPGLESLWTEDDRSLDQIRFYRSFISTYGFD